MVKKDKVRLGDVCTIVSGTTPKTGTKEYWDGELNWITPAELSDDIDIIYKTERKITNKAVTDSSLKLLPVGTVLLSSRAPIGKVAIVGSPMYCNQGFKNLICSNSIFNKFLYWFLKGKKDFLNSLGRGATFKEISKSIVEDIQISLPSLSEQKRIAAILDKATEIITLRKQQIEKLDLLVKSRFIEMFGDPVQNEKGWPIVALEEIAAIRIGPFGSLLHKEDYIEGGHALVNPSHIVEGKICIDSRLTISPEKYNELNAYHLEVDDIVLGRRGEMGRCAVIHSAGLLCGTGSMIIRPNKRMKPYFLQTILSSPTYKKTIEDRAVGITMMNLNVPTVSALPIPLLPLDLQENFIAILQQVDKTKSTLQQSLEKLELNYKALMQTYFR